MRRRQVLASLRRRRDVQHAGLMCVHGIWPADVRSHLPSSGGCSRTSSSSSHFGGERNATAFAWGSSCCNVSHEPIMCVALRQEVTSRRSDNNHMTRFDTLRMQQRNKRAQACASLSARGHESDDEISRQKTPRRGVPLCVRCKTFRKKTNAKHGRKRSRSVSSAHFLPLRGNLRTCSSRHGFLRESAQSPPNARSVDAVGGGSVSSCLLRTP